MARPRLNNWWVPGEGIARVVISADIQRYLGPDALVKPGENEGRQGYWVTAYRTLTSEMIQDLKLDTQRWEREQDSIGGRRGQQDQLAAYRDSQIHQSRQYYGPTGDDPYGGQQQSAPSRGYADTGNYTHTNAPTGYTQQGGYQVQPTYNTHVVPRTQQTVSQYSQGGYAPTTGRTDHQGYAAQQQQTHRYATQQTGYYTGQHQQTAQAPPPPTQSRTARPGWYFASDGKEYPIPASGLPGQQR